MVGKKILLIIYRIISSVFGRYHPSRFYPIKVVNSYLLGKFKSNFVNVLGHKMFLDSNDSLNLSIFGIYEKFETELIKNEVNQDDIILDIGANIGYYTLIFAKLVGERGKVYAFEPDPINFKLLKKNIEINGYKNVVLINKAVSDKTGKLKLFLSEENHGDHRTYDSNDGRSFLEIDCVKLDDYFKNQNSSINFIKMDIQGSEFQALKGMDELINKNNKLKIITEFWPVGLKQSGVEISDFLNLILKHGFKIKEINEEKNRVIPLENLTDLQKKYTIEKKNFTNLLCEKNI